MLNKVRQIAAAWVALAVIATLLSPPARAAGVDALDVKIAMIGKVATFLRWPDGRDETFTIAFLEADNARERAAKYYQRQSVSGQPVRVVRVESVEQVANADVLFVGRDAGDRIDRIRRALRGRGVVTMADTKGFAARGICVNFVVDGGRVALEVNRACLSESGVSASFRLLSLARVVGEGATALGRSL